MLADRLLISFITQTTGRTISGVSTRFGSPSSTRNYRQRRSAILMATLTVVFNGFCKADLIRGRGLRRTVDLIELSTLENVW